VSQPGHARVALEIGTFSASAVVAFLFTIVAAFALTFPTLTGRVVDQANIISAATRSALEQKLAGLEARSGIQLVVATISSLEGQEIEPYGNELFRTWKLGEKTKNNGVLLLVAPNERRVRIEVGYGLEGTLTDALSKVIITNAIAPRFKAGDFADGVTRGVDDIITVLTTDASEWQKRPSLRLDNQQAPDPASWLLIAALIAAGNNGLVIPIYLQHYKDAPLQTIANITPILQYGIAVNLAFDYIYTGAFCVAILCWSIAILMTKKLPLWIGWFGIALSLLTATVFISGTAVNNVHGLRIFVTSIVVWILLIGAVLCKEK